MVRQTHWEGKPVSGMRRREFITLLGGAAAAWPVAARAQQQPAMPVIGCLIFTSPDFADRVGAFRQGLKDTGLVEGENVEIEFRWADNQVDRLPELASQLVRRKVAVIAAMSARSALAAKEATSTIPIVFSSGADPVRLGLVTNLARPEGNLTGVTFLASELGAKRLEILRELVPGTVRVAVLANPRVDEGPLRDVQAAARVMGLQIQIFNVSTSHEIDAAFATFLRERPDVLFAVGDPLFASRRVQLANLAARHLLPSAFAQREIAEVGGLMSYGSSLGDAWRQAGVYAGRILKGAKPADLPVVQSSKFELVINAQTARMLGLKLPPTLLATADEVIE
jgi:putative tryptophan/tyrosine transport system substrate-binding protein